MLVLAQKVNDSFSSNFQPFSLSLHICIGKMHIVLSCSLCDCLLTFLMHGKILHIRDS